MEYIIPTSRNFFSVILHNITVPAAILRNITQTYANSRNIMQYYAILRKFTHVNSCKTYVFKSLRKFTQCKLTQTYAQIYAILRYLPQYYAILRSLRKLTQYYVKKIFLMQLHRISIYFFYY